MGGEVETTGAGVCVGVAYVGSVSVAGLAGGGGTACMGLLDGGVTVAGGGTGGATGCGLGFKVPGGAASVTGAPHCSQKSPSRSSGPLQKRQTTAPGWVTGLSKDFFNNSSSISTIWSPRLGRAYTAGALGRGAITGVGAIFSGTVGDALGGGAAAGAGGAGAKGAAGIGGSAPTGRAAGGGVGAREAPHWRQKRIPSGTPAWHFGQVSILLPRTKSGSRPKLQTHIITPCATSQASFDANLTNA